MMVGLRLMKKIVWFEWCANDVITRPYQDNKHKHHLFYKHIVSEYIYAGRCVIGKMVFPIKRLLWLVK